MLGMGPAAVGDEVDTDLTNAGKVPVTELPGASYFHHADSFAMMRGGHLDVCVLGAFQVSQHGDLANWHTGAPDAIPAVGGAMDLAIGAKQVFVMMTLFAKDGTAKLVSECTYPLTGLRCVSRVYTDYAVFQVGPGALGSPRPTGSRLPNWQHEWTSPSSAVRRCPGDHRHDDLDVTTLHTAAFGTSGTGRLTRSGAVDRTSGSSRTSRPNTGFGSRHRCGEGADAIWLAGEGWTVTAVDVSTVALERAARHAAAAGPDVAPADHLAPEDLREWTPEPESYDLVSEQFLHLPSALRIRQHQRARAVRPGGMLLVVGHHPGDNERCSDRTRRTCSHRRGGGGPAVAAGVGRVGDDADPAVARPRRQPRDDLRRGGPGGSPGLTGRVNVGATAWRTTGVPVLPVARLGVPWLSGRRPFGRR